MKGIMLIAAAVAVAAPAPAARAGSPGAVCSLEFRVGVDAVGRIDQRGAATAHCAGAVGPTMVEPGTAPAFITGRARPGCVPVPSEGELTVGLKRLMSFDPRRDVMFRARWTASGVGLASAISGRGVAGGWTSSFIGAARFMPTACGTGTVQMELVIEPGRRPGRDTGATRRPDALQRELLERGRLHPPANDGPYRR